jgi:hypothetical protein
LTGTKKNWFFPQLPATTKQPQKMPSIVRLYTAVISTMQKLVRVITACCQYFGLIASYTHLPGLDVEYCSVRHGVEERPEGGVTAAVVESVKQLHVGDEDRDRLARLQT